MDSESAKTMKTGIAYLLLAYGIWGFLPVYWKLLQEVSDLEILTHRIFWSAVFFTVLLGIRSGRKFRDEIRMASEYLKPLLLSAVLISANWFTYIYAVNSGQVLESSLGYFINPLVSVLLGRIFFKERLAPLQTFAVILAAIGVIQLAMEGDRIPWIALFLAFSFGIYGLIRKQIPVAALSASTFESLLLALPALGLMISLQSGNNATPHSSSVWTFLILAGAVTALPLLWFAEAAKRLPLSTVGILQYISPTIQFSLAVFVYNEPFESVHARAFAFIWAALSLYTFHLIRSSRRARKQRLAPLLQTTS